MDNASLRNILDAIDFAGIADGLIAKLSKEYEISEEEAKEQLKNLIIIINTIKNLSL